MKMDHPKYISTPISLVPADGLVIEFPEDNSRQAGVLAQDLKITIDNLAADQNVKVTTSVEKVNPQAQDIGTILAVVLGAKATIEIAKGIAGWLQKRNRGRIRIRKADGTIVDITKAESADMPGILKAMTI